MCTFTSATELVPDYLGDFYSRRLLLHTTLYTTKSSAAPAAPGNSHGPSEQYSGYNTLDANVVMVLAVLLCAIIGSLGLHSIIRCALRCSSLVASEPAASNPSARLANTGVKRKVLRTFLTVTFSTDSKLPGLDTECVICLSEFTTGDRVRLLPYCNHGFHVRCIDKWLSSHSSCPTCRHCLIETCPKIVGCSQASSSEHPPPVQESISNIAPLQPERFICNYR